MKSKVISGIFFILFVVALVPMSLSDIEDDLLVEATCCITRPSPTNIAFIDRQPDGLVIVLTKQGQVWTHAQNSNAAWVHATWLDTPISPKKIVAWRMDMFLDVDGDMWTIPWDGQWINVGHP